MLLSFRLDVARHFSPQVRVRNLAWRQPFSPLLVVAHTRVSSSKRLVNLNRTRPTYEAILAARESFYEGTLPYHRHHLVFLAFISICILAHPTVNFTVKHQEGLKVPLRHGCIFGYKILYLVGVMLCSPCRSKHQYPL